MKSLLKLSILPGLTAAIAMIPYGLVLMNVLKLPINIYGEKTLQLFMVKPTYIMMFIEHLLISYIFAIPVIWLMKRFRLYTVSAFVLLLSGAFYGLVIWLVFNSLLLPLLYHDLSPWKKGWYAMWPSMTAHILYGFVAAAVGKRLRVAEM